jgi:hypothetical protein
MTNFKLTALAALSGLVIAGCLPATVFTTVSATNNIFLAGQPATAANSTPACTTANLGCLPFELDFIPVAGNTLMFTGPGAPTPGNSGGVSACANPVCSTTTPDGNNLGSAAPATSLSYSGTTISQIQFTGVELFLIGVFLGPSLPGSQVASIGDYGTGAISPNQVTYTPLVGQTFFVGDGLTGTGSGTVQQWVVPVGATRLFLGFADGMAFTGQTQMYGDNTGSASVSLQIVPAAAAPEPGTVALLALGLAALALGRRKLFV